MIKPKCRPVLCLLSCLWAASFHRSPVSPLHGLRTKSSAVYPTPPKWWAYVVTSLGPLKCFRNIFAGWFPSWAMTLCKVWTFTVLIDMARFLSVLADIPPERMWECSFLSSLGRNPGVLFCFVFGQTLKHFCHSGEITIVVFISISLLMSCIKNHLAICVPFSLNCLFLFFGHFYIGLLIFYNWFARVKLAFYPLCDANIFF